MAWLSRNNFTTSDRLHADDLNNLANDQRTWGGDVNGGGHVLSNVTLVGVTTETAAAVTSVFGRTGDVVATAGDYTAAQVGAVPTARQVIAGPGLSGGGPLSADVTLDALVLSVFGRTGAVMLTPTDLAAANGVTYTRQILTGTGLAGGGNLGADLTLSVVPDSINQRVQVMSAGAVIGTRHAINLIAGANMTATVADDNLNNRVNITLASTATPGVNDPTTTLGDLLVRGPAVVSRLGVGASGQVLTADSTSPLGVKWAAQAGAAPVSSVFGRTGVVAAAAGDYTAAQVTGAVDASQTYADPAWVTSLNWNKIINAPSFLINVLTTKGDIPVQISASSQGRLPVGADATVLTADSAQPLGLKWAAAPGTGAQPQTPWASDIDAAYHNLTHVRGIGVGGSSGTPAAATAPYPLYVVTASTGADASPTTSSVLITDLNTQLQLGVSQHYNAAGTPAGAPWIQAFAGTTPTALILQPAGASLGVGQAQPAHALDVAGDVNVSGTYRIDGVAIAVSQTPWASDIDAANYKLSNVTAIGIGGPVTAAGLTLQYPDASISLISPNPADNPLIDFSLGGTYHWEIGVGLDVAGNFYIRDIVNGTRLQIDAVGNVGLGLPPVYALDVVGDINCTGTFRVNGIAAGGVISVFGRTGDVVSSHGDYTAAQVTNAVDASQSYADPTWITALSWSKIIGAPAAGVSTVFGRSGAVLAASGDYTVAQITGAVANTRAINTGTGLTGGGNLSADRTLAVVPDSVNEQVQILNGGTLVATRHAINFVSGANVALSISDNASSNWVDVTVASSGGGGTGSGMPDPTTTLGDLIVRGPSVVERFALGTAGQVLAVDGTSPVGIRWVNPGAASQTPWLSDIDAASHDLQNVANIGVGGAADSSTRVLVTLAGTEDGLQVVSSITSAFARITLINNLDSTLGLVIYDSAYATDANMCSIEASRELLFKTYNAEAMRLVSGGHVLVGTTVDDGANLLQVNGTIKSASGGYVFPDGTTQTTAATPATAPVRSVFGRTGLVAAQAGDYTASQVTNAADMTASYNDPSWIVGLNWSKIQGVPAFVPASRQIATGTGLTGGGSLAADRTLSVVPDSVNQQVQVLNAGTLVGTRHAVNLIQGTNVTLTIADDSVNNRVNVTVAANPAAAVSSVFGRSGAVVAQSGDYSAALVTNAVDQTGSYANPAWITALAWSKITGAPGVSSYQTPWLSDIDASGHNLNNVGNVNAFWVNAQVGGGLFLNTSSTILRWKISGVGTESGGNTGNDLAIVPSMDNGSSLPTAVTIVRANGRVGIGVTAPVSPLEVAVVSGQSSIRSGSLELQPFALNNVVIADNVFYNGSQWTYRAAGYGAAVHTLTGDVNIQSWPSGAAGANAGTPKTILHVQGDGSVGLGLNTANPATTAGAPVQVGTDGTLRLQCTGGGYAMQICPASNLARWSFRAYGGESGGDTGSDLYIGSHHDDGTLASNVITIQRATGGVTFVYNVQVGNSLYVPNTIYVTGSAGIIAINSTQVVYEVAAGTARWKVQNWGTESGGNSGSDYYISRCADDGSQLDNALHIIRSSGEVQLSNNLTVASDLHVGGSAFITGDIICSSFVGIGVSSPGSALHVAGRITAQANSEPYSISIPYASGYPNIWLGSDANGNMHISDNSGTAHFMLDQDGGVSLHAPQSFDLSTLLNGFLTFNYLSATNQLKLWLRGTDGVLRSCLLNFS